MDSYVIIGRFLSYFGHYVIKYMTEKVTWDRVVLGPMQPVIWEKNWVLNDPEKQTFKATVPH
jgi:hypothetical protein